MNIYTLHEFTDAPIGDHDYKTLGPHITMQQVVQWTPFIILVGAALYGAFKGFGG